MACDNGDHTTLLRSTTIQLSLHFISQLLVIPDPSIFLPEDSEINMPIVSVNIRDTAAPNNTKDNSVSFVTTLSNVNNDPPKQDIVYCVNTTELFTIILRIKLGLRNQPWDLIFYIPRWIYSSKSASGQLGIIYVYTLFKRRYPIIHTKVTMHVYISTI